MMGTTENQSLGGSNVPVAPVHPPYLLNLPVPTVAPRPTPSVGAAWLSMLKHTRIGEWASLFAKLVGAALFATLVYTYCNVLIEACIRGIH